eukprot:TRINITY_DN48651_c0_g1_i1.p1 TRINITY_DN48651_c0_g1~~TRINITY_DN48651_c0_g1_i1.p1  ORF type:complete len:256 (+),score=44.98 TRINITY_DN48651_c0_g1_i1:48-815(+)
MATVGASSAVDHAECTLCFEDLCSAPLAILINENAKRVCRHFFHHDCLKEVHDFAEGNSKDMTCPVCREPCTDIIKMPDPATSAEKWFEMTDTDGNGDLSFREVTDVVRATCNISDADADNIIKGKWADFDKDGNQGIQWEEFSTLLTFIFENLPENLKVEVPSITEDKEKWFKFWDEDGSGSLDKDELARALIKTFKKDAIVKVSEIQEILECVWPLFDPNGDNTISLDEFLQKGGLANAIVTSLNYTSKKDKA